MPSEVWIRKFVNSQIVQFFFHSTQRAEIKLLEIYSSVKNKTSDIDTVIVNLVENFNIEVKIFFTARVWIQMLVKHSIVFKTMFLPI
jgi:hypothetical protein